MFDSTFYREVLPERVTKECQGRPGDVPVVELRLANGLSLDVCHIAHLSDTWLAIQYFRDVETCAEMDLAFLPYDLVTMVTVSLHHPETRTVGFKVTDGAASLTHKRTDSKR